MSTVFQVSAEPKKVKLLEDTPFQFLADSLDGWIPVSPWLMSLNGKDCYEFDPAVLSDHETMKQLAKAITSDAYPEYLLMGLFRYNCIYIPVEWVAVVEIA